MLAPVADEVLLTIERAARPERRHAVPPVVQGHRDVTEIHQLKIRREIPAYNHRGTVVVACAWLAFYVTTVAGVFLMTLLGCLVIVVIIAKKRFFSLPASSHAIAARGSVGHGLAHRLMRAWGRSKQRRLQRHLQLTITASRLQRYNALSLIPPAGDRYRHHPYIRD